ncbi:MAG: archease [Methanosphaera sp.]|uniref:archease n=1 Tax=Methanosphaera sp. TaxID=2666342 RepID=UPI0025FDE19C|nr:archease [Methanosphaera sp.]MCI5866552.1 archease [Methanosphaera sp.]MDD6535028.1 archease [Methanosphaera sp.]MDY3955461.1 archease [Methanosphaera sp.]
MRNNFKYFDTTADIGVEVEADSLEDAFIKSAQATLNLISDYDKIQPKIEKSLTINAEDEYGLLYDWVTELLINLSCDNYMPADYDVKITQDPETSQYTLKADMLGDIYDTTIYNYKTEVKAITYHLMKVNMDDNNVHIKFILDL